MTVMPPGRLNPSARMNCWLELAPVVGEGGLVSAQTGYGLDTLRARIATVHADLWEDIDLAIVDLLLPDCVGTELIGELRADGGEVRVLTADRGPNLRAVCP